MLRTIRSRASRRRGAVMVEAAIVLSMFLLLILTTIEMGRMGEAQQLLACAAREGCSVAVISGTTQSDVDATIAPILNGGGISLYDTTITPSTFTAASLGSPVTVTISTQFRNISWLANPLFLGSATLSASATLSSERAQ